MLHSCVGCIRGRCNKPIFVIVGVSGVHLERCTCGQSALVLGGEYGGWSDTRFKFKMEGWQSSQLFAVRRYGLTNRTLMRIIYHCLGMVGYLLFGLYVTKAITSVDVAYADADAVSRVISCMLGVLLIVDVLNWVLSSLFRI